MFVAFCFLYVTRIVDNAQTQNYVLANCAYILICFFSFLCDYSAQSSNIKRYMFIGKCISKEASNEPSIQYTSKMVCVCVCVPILF